MVASSELNDFISINPSNGVGTIIGSIGMKNILGLAYIESSPTGVEDEKPINFPTEYCSVSELSKSIQSINKYRISNFEPRICISESL